MTTTAPVSPISPENARPARRLRKAVNLAMCDDGATVLEKFRVLRDAGFDGVELNRPDATPLDEIRSAAAATGLDVAGIICATHWEKPLSDPDAAVREQGLCGLLAALDDARQLGCGHVLLVPGIVNAAVGYDACWERTIPAIRDAAVVAEKSGVRIGIENVWNHFLLSPLEAVRYLDEIGSASVGWHFDPGNVVTFGWPEQWIRLLGTRLFNLHLKDYSRAKRDAEGLWKGFDVELGEGDVDWAAVMEALDAIGYRGYGTAEVPGGGATRMRFLADRIDELFQR